MTVTSTTDKLKTNLEEAVGYLVPVSDVDKKDTLVRITEETIFPEFKDKTLLLPSTYLNSDDEHDIIFRAGQGAGLLALYCGNKKLRRLFSEIKSPEYIFWSRQAMVLGGLSALHEKLRPDTKEVSKVADKLIQSSRHTRLLSVDDDIEHDFTVDVANAYVGQVGVDYAAQLYNKYGREAFPTVIGTSSVGGIHRIIKCPREDFRFYLSNFWKSR